MSDRSLYEFGPFRLDAAEQLLLRGGLEVKVRVKGKETALPPKAFGVLLMLVRNSGHLLTKDDILREVWKDAVVEEKAVADSVSVIRQALGEGPQESLYVKTEPRRGYRFVAEVREVHAEELAIVERTRERIEIEEEREDDLSPALVPQSTSPSVESYSVAAAQDSGRALALPAGTSSPKRMRAVWIAGLLFLLAGAVAVAFYLRGRRTGSAPPPARSIAVLPFKPLVAESGDPALELGMTDALISKLSNIRQLTVRPTTSVMKYKGEGLDLRAVGSELGVDVLVDGKVQRAGDRVRLSVQMVRASDGAPVWAETFDAKFTDIFNLQDTISERVAGALALKLSGEERKGLSRRYTDSVEAYQLYLQGRAQWRTFTPKGLMTSINYYHAALEKDPGYALAYAGIAGAYNVIGIYGPLTAKEAGPKAREAAEKAVQLDPNLSEAHMALGTQRLLYEWDWEGARREFERSIELNPNTDGHAPYGYYLEAMRRSDESLAELKRARDLAPGWDLANTDYAWHLFIERRYDEAIAFSEQELRLNPEIAEFYMVLGMTHTQQGKYDEAVRELERAVSLKDGSDPSAGLFSQAELGVTYALMGRREEAQRQIELIKRQQNSWTPFLLAEIYTSLGDKETAFAWLEKAYEERCPFLYEVSTYPQFAPLHSDPRYAELLRRMNLK